MLISLSGIGPRGIKTTWSNRLKFRLRTEYWSLPWSTVVYIWGAGGLYLEGWFNGGFFALRVWGAYILEGLIHRGAYLWNFMVYCCSITEEPLLLSVYLTIMVNKAKIEKQIAISINSPDYYYNKWISLKLRRSLFSNKILIQLVRLYSTSDLHFIVIL